nr:MAG: hypothetical protein DIU62_03150 [Pseudomonadota bacterium]
MWQASCTGPRPSVAASPASCAVAACTRASLSRNASASRAGSFRVARMALMEVSAEPRNMRRACGGARSAASAESSASCVSASVCCTSFSAETSRSTSSRASPSAERCRLTATWRGAPPPRGASNANTPR